MRPVLSAIAEMRTEISLRRALAPHADPDTRCPEAMTRIVVARVSAEQARREQDAAEAREEATQAAAALPRQSMAFAAIGFTTRVQAEVDRLVVRADWLGQCAEENRLTREGAARMRRKARDNAYLHGMVYADWQRTIGTVLDARNAALDSVEGMLRRHGPHALAAIRTHGLEALVEAEVSRLAMVGASGLDDSTAPLRGSRQDDFRPRDEEHRGQHALHRHGR